MEYSIGSVADLISGSTTPNKPKAIQKQFKIKPNLQAFEETEIEGIQKEKKQTKLKRKRTDSPKNKVEIEDLEEHVPSEEESDQPPVIKLKRRRSKSSKIKQLNTIENSDTIPDITDSDTSDDEQLVKTPKKKKLKTINEIAPKNPDHITVFVGNLPVTTTHKKLQNHFSKIGNVINARIRSIAVADPKVPKKVAAIKKQFHPDRKSVHGYVTFASREDADKALAANGSEYKGHHIRVNICDEKQEPDKTKAIFLGNVSFAAEEEELWKLFESCGEIESVRLVRDRRTDIGKGFGYINFKSSDSVELALQMDEVKLRDRVLRISLYNGKAPKKAKMQKPHKKSGKPNAQKKEHVVTTAVHGQFQGKFATEKKKKFNKGNQQKKKLAKKIAPKTMSN